MSTDPETFDGMGARQRTVTFRISEEEAERIEGWAESLKLDRSKLVRAGLFFLLDRLETSIGADVLEALAAARKPRPPEPIKPTGGETDGR